MSTLEDNGPTEELVEAIAQALRGASPTLSALDPAGRRQLGMALAVVRSRSEVWSALCRLGGLVRSEILESAIEEDLDRSYVRGQIQGVARFIATLENIVRNAAAEAVEQAEEAGEGKKKKSMLEELSALAGSGESGLAVGDWDEADS